MQRYTVNRSVMQRYTVECSVMQRYTVNRSVMQRYTVNRSVMQRYTVECSGPLWKSRGRRWGRVTCVLSVEALLPLSPHYHCPQLSLCLTVITLVCAIVAHTPLSTIVDISFQHQIVVTCVWSIPLMMLLGFMFSCPWTLVSPDTGFPLSSPPRCCLKVLVQPSLVAPRVNSGLLLFPFCFGASLCYPQINVLPRFIPSPAFLVAKWYAVPRLLADIIYGFGPVLLPTPPTVLTAHAVSRTPVLCLPQLINTLLTAGWRFFPFRHWLPRGNQP